MRLPKKTTRVFDGFGAAATLISLALCLLTYTEVRRIKATAIRITGDTMPSIYLSGQLQSITLLRYSLLTDYVDRGEVEDPGLVPKIDSANAQIDRIMSEYESLIDVPADSRLFDRLKSARKPYDECFLRVLRLRREGKREEARSLIGTELIPLRNAFLAAAEAEVVWNKADADDSANAITKALSWASTGLLIGLALLSGLAWVVLGFRKQLRMERTLRESEERFHEVFEYGPVGMCVAGPDGRFIQVNDAFCKMLGYSQQELLDKFWPDLCPSEDLADALRVKEQLWAGTIGRVEMERRYIHRSGAVIWCNQRISVLRAGDGRPLYSVVHVEDVTERRRAEEILRESEERFRTFADACPSILWVTDARGELEFINKAFRKFFGTTCEEVQSDKWHLLLHPDDAPAYIARFQRATVERASFSSESRVRRADGQWRMLGIRAEARISPAGEYLGHIGLSADITDRKEAEAAARESHEFAQATIDALSSHICVLNEAGTVIAVNRAWKDFAEANWRRDSRGTGIDATAHDACGMGVNYLAVCDGAVGPESKEAAEFAEGIRSVLHGKRKQYTKEYPCDSPCESRWFIGRVTRFSSGSIPRVAIEHINMTERKRAEEALRESEERFRIMADSCPIGIWVTDVQGGMRFINQTHREFYGTTSEQVGPDEWRGLVHPDDAQGFCKAFDQSLKEHKPFVAERRSRRADGEWRWMESHGQPRFSPEGEFLGLVGTSKDVTNRKQAEQALRVSEEKFRQLAENIHEVFFMMTPFGNELLYVSPAYEEVWGRTVDTVYQNPMSWAEAIHPDDREKAGLLAARQLQGELVASEFRIQIPDGRERWIRSRCSPVRDQAGELIRIVGIAEDITERKQSLQALENSEEKFRQLAENIKEVFWMMNAAGTEILFVGPAYEQIWGRTCKSLYEAPMDWIEAIHPDDREHAHETFMKQLRGDGVDSEYRIRTPDGQEKWIRDRAFPVRDQSGAVIRVAGIAEEITEQKRHEEELIRAREAAEAANRRLAAQHATLDNERKILRAFIDNVPDLMYVKDLESRFVVANPEVARWMRVERPEDLLGKTDFDFYPRDTASLFYEEEQRVMRSGEPIVDNEQTTSSGPAEEVRYLLSTKVPLFDTAGQVTGIAGIGRDITMRKAIEDEIRCSNRELQEATDWANKLALEADAANVAKSRFLANMSHEIRTPMNGVIGMNQLLLETELTDEQRRYVEVAQTSGRALLTLIDDILDLSKIEAGKVTLENRRLDLNSIVEGVVQLLRVQAEAKGLEFEARISAKIPGQLCGDAHRLRQVLTNLAGNAIKFTRQGRVTLEAELEDRGERSATVLFTVIDTGIGMRPDQAKAVFSPFVQADASTTRKYGGTGLGLAISKQLVELMGGSIGVNSREGKGSTFWFTAVFEQAAPAELLPTNGTPDASVDSSIGAAQAGMRETGHGEKILVAEDNPTNREVVLAQLKKLGYSGEAVLNGAQAVDALLHRDFAMVLMDCQMPVMDGFEATRRIRESIQRHVPIVALTASAMSSDRDRCLKEGMDDYLSKPLELPQLAAMLSKWVPVPGSLGTRAKPPANSANPPAAVFDLESLLQRLMGDRELAGSVLEGFLEDVPAQLRQLSSRLDAEDASGVRLQSHTLKGAAATVAAEALSQIALAMETAASAGLLDDCRGLLPHAVDEFERFKKALELGGWASHASGNSGIEETSDVQS